MLLATCSSQNPAEKSNIRKWSRPGARRTEAVIEASKIEPQLSIKRLLEWRKWTSSAFKSGHRICSRRSLYNGDGATKEEVAKSAGWFRAAARVKGRWANTPLEINARVTQADFTPIVLRPTPFEWDVWWKKIQMWNFHFRPGSPARKKYFLRGRAGVLGSPNAKAFALETFLCCMATSLAHLIARQQWFISNAHWFILGGMLYQRLLVISFYSARLCVHDVLKNEVGNFFIST